MVSARWFEEGAVIVRREGNGKEHRTGPPVSGRRSATMVPDDSLEPSGDEASHLPGARRGPGPGGGAQQAVHPGDGPRPAVHLSACRPSNSPTPTRSAVRAWGTSPP